MASRADTLQQGSFRGVQFNYLDAGSAHGRRGQLHEYPASDYWHFEDLGLKARQYTLDIFALGDDWPAQRQALIAAFEKKGSGPFVHPTDGKLTVNCTDLRRQENVTQLGLVSFTVTLVEDVSAQAPQAAQDTGSGVDSAGNAVLDAGIGDFDVQLQPVQTASLDIPDVEVQIAGEDALSGALSAVASAIGLAVDIGAGAAAWVSYGLSVAGSVVRFAAGVSSAFGGSSATSGVLTDSARSLEWVAGVSAITSTPSLALQYAGLGAELGSIVSGISGLYVTGSEIGSAASTGGTASSSTGSGGTGSGATGDAFTGWAAQRRAGVARSIVKAASSTDAGAGFVTVQTGGLPASSIGTLFRTHLSLVTALQPPAAAAGASDAATSASNAIYARLRQAALIEASGALSAYPFASAGEASAMQSVLADAIDAEIALIGPGTVAQALRQLKTAAVSDVKARSAALPDLISLTLPQSIPALVLAMRLYDDPGRALEIVTLNDIANPLFVPNDPGAAIQVLNA